MNGFKDGIIGFFLFFAHWLSPQTEKASLGFEYIKKEPHAIITKCKMNIAWNKQLEQLVDAGIPLRFKIAQLNGKADTVDFYRTLNFNMIDYTYNFTDSTSSSTSTSKNYRLIDLALRDFCKWNVTVPDTVSECRVEVDILPSRAEQFNKVLDMSRVWGQQKVYSSFNPNQIIPKRAASRRK